MPSRGCSSSFIPSRPGGHSDRRRGGEVERGDCGARSARSADVGRGAARRRGDPAPERLAVRIDRSRLSAGQRTPRRGLSTHGALVRPAHRPGELRDNRGRARQRNLGQQRITRGDRGCIGLYESVLADAPSTRVNLIASAHHSLGTMHTYRIRRVERRRPIARRARRHFADALRFRTREQMPESWAQTQHALGRALLAAAAGDGSRGRAAVEPLVGALEVYAERAAQRPRGSMRNRRFISPTASSPARTISV